MKTIRLVLIVGMILALLTVNVSAASPGAIAFVGFNADDTDGFAFVLLTGANAGSIVYFTDKQWDGSAFIGSEGFSQWTAPAGGLATGTVVVVSGVATSSPSVTAGDFTKISGSMNLGGGEEAIYAYQGSDESTPTQFLALVSNDTLANASASLANTGLTEGTTAIVITGDEDVMVYSGGTSFVNESAAHTSLGNAANWTTQDGSNDQDQDAITPDFPDDLPGNFTISSPTAITLRGLSASSAGAGLPVMGLALAGLLVGAVVVRRR